MTVAGVRQLNLAEEESASRSCVVLVRCDSYDEATVDGAVKRGLALLGGPRQFVEPGEKILLKPNVLVASEPDQAVTTHPAVFGAVARELQAASANLTYGDSTGLSFGLAGQHVGRGWLPWRMIWASRWRISPAERLSPFPRAG